jgi:hypothetical protein
LLQKGKTAGETRDGLAISIKNSFNFIGKNTINMIVNEHFVLFTQEERTALEESLK